MSKIRRVYDKICGVCGDKSSGRNFGGISCEPCKGFFRRIISNNSNVNMKCEDKNNCEITKFSRKFCKKCRFDKCLAIGMRKELMMIVSNPDQQDYECNTTESNTEITTESTTSPNITSEESNPISVSLLTPNSSIDFNDIQTSDLTEFEGDLDLNDFCLTDEELSQSILDIEDLLSTAQKSNETEVTQTETNSSVVPIVKPIATYNKEFNDFEYHRMSELMRASNLLQWFTRPETSYIDVDDLNQLYQIPASMNLYDINIKDSANFCKGIALFKEFSEDDKMAMFKNSCWKLILLKYPPMYYDNFEIFYFAISNEHTIRCNLDMFRIVGEDNFDLKLDFAKDFTENWVDDPILISLLMAIVVFEYDSPNLSHRQIARLNQQMYIYLLQRYLLQKFKSEDKSAESLSKLMKNLQTLHKIQIMQKTFAKHYLPCLTPLVKEVFDL